MPDVKIRPEVVALLLDIKDLTEFAKGSLTHEDGRPFTDEEFKLAGSAVAAELRACMDYSKRAADLAEERMRDLDRAMEIMEPYFVRLGPDAVVDDVRKVVTPEEGEELDAIFERTAPDGYIVA